MQRLQDVQRRLQQSRIVFGQVNAGTGPTSFMRHTGAASGVNPPAQNYIRVERGGHFISGDVRADNNSTIVFGNQDNSIRNSNNQSTRATTTTITTNTTTSGGFGSGLKAAKIMQNGKKVSVICILLKMLTPPTHPAFPRLLLYVVELGTPRGYRHDGVQRGRPGPARAYQPCKG